MIKTVLKKLIRGLGLEGYRSGKILISQIQAVDPKATLVGGKVCSCGLEIDPVKDRWILESVPILVDLQTASGFSFRSSGSTLRAVRGKTEFEIISHLETGIVFDVYSRGVYRLLTSEPVLLIDVGANIGVSAVYAATELGAEVHGFELVPAVASRAAEHVERNKLSGQVTIHPFGLGRADEEIEVLFSENLTGETSLHFATCAGAEAKKIPCTVKSVEVLRPILEASAKRKFLKLDCEGSEYSILEALSGAGLLSHFDGFLLEYHEIPNDRGRVWLEEFLVENGYDVPSFLRPGYDHEMMYAFRR